MKTDRLSGDQVTHGKIGLGPLKSGQDVFSDLNRIADPVGSGGRSITCFTNADYNPYTINDVLLMPRRPRPALVPQPGFGASSLLSIYDLIERARPQHIHPCGKIAKGDDPQRADGRDENKEECRWRQVALQDRENGYIGRAACC
jgi:hypothetical protein